MFIIYKIKKNLRGGPRMALFALIQCISFFRKMKKEQPSTIIY